MPRAVIPNYLTNALLGLVTLGNGNVHCGDLFFSGHTIVLCCCWYALLVRTGKAMWTCMFLRKGCFAYFVHVCIFQCRFFFNKRATQCCTCSVYFAHILRILVFPPHICPFLLFCYLAGLQKRFMKAKAHFCPESKQGDGAERFKKCFRNHAPRETPSHVADNWCTFSAPIHLESPPHPGLNFKPPLL